MPLSKKRKKNGKVVKNSRAKRTRRINEISDEQLTGVSLQDLINVLAYQEYVADGTIVPEGPQIDFEDPDTQAIIKAVDSVSKNEEN